MVYQLQVHTIGGVIGKGDTVMQIAPRADALIIEAKVTPQDIDQVAVGASVSGSASVRARILPIANENGDYVLRGIHLPEMVGHDTCAKAAGALCHTGAGHLNRRVDTS